jgi:hypothetical protein
MTVYTLNDIGNRLGGASKNPNHKLAADVRKRRSDIWRRWRALRRWGFLTLLVIVSYALISLVWGSPSLMPLHRWWSGPPPKTTVESLTEIGWQIFQELGPWNPSTNPGKPCGSTGKCPCCKVRPTQHQLMW